MSEVTNKTTAELWAPSVVLRRRARLARLAMGAATAMIFSPILGWDVALVWGAVYFAVQLADALIFKPIAADDKVGHMGPWRIAAGAAMLFLNGASFSSLSVLLWTHGGTMGGVCAAIVLSSGAIYAVVNSPRSVQVLTISLAPHLAFMAASPVFMSLNGARPSFVSAASIAICVFAAYCISIWRNIDRAYASESQARLAAEQREAQAEAALASRSAFLAAIGHDLRTPIGAILTASTEMNHGTAEGGARAQAALIGDAGLMMKALLDDLLDHAKLDAGRMTVEADDFNLRSMLAQTLRLWAGPVRAKGLNLRIEGAREAPQMVRGDAMRLRQVLNNLVSNALKFTQSGTVTLRVRAWAEEPTGHAILIEVTDTGPGMTTAQLNRLFTPFDQTADGVSARHGGSGLGLAISRDLVELMGGRLTARSEPGKGSTFTLSLVLDAAINPRPVVAPLDAETRIDVSRALFGRSRTALPSNAMIPVPMEGAVEVEPTATIEATPDAEGPPLRVLVVDDHEINRRAVELILTPLGCAITAAADGMAALDQCQIDAFDVIFMDVRMPELDGRETTRRLRAGGGPNADVPVIAVTADTGPDDIAACLDAGMTYFVSKPLTPSILLDALQTVLADADEVDGGRAISAA